jgi:hypothetical protein
MINNQKVQLFVTASKVLFIEQLETEPGNDSLFILARILDWLLAIICKTCPCFVVNLFSYLSIPTCKESFIANQSSGIEGVLEFRISLLVAGLEGCQLAAETLGGWSGGCWACS